MTDIIKVVLIATILALLVTWTLPVKSVSKIKVFSYSIVAVSFLLSGLLYFYRGYWP